MSDDLTVFRFDIDADAVRTVLDSILGLSPADLDGLESAADTATGTERSPTAPSAERTGPRVGETPPPGAGDTVAEHDYNGPTESDDGRNMFLLAGAGVTLVGTIAAVGAVLYRRRSTGSDDLPIPDVDTSLGLLGEDEDSEDDIATDGSQRSDTDRSESAVDAAPLVGMALLAVGGAVVRYVQSSD